MWSLLLYTALTLAPGVEQSETDLRAVYARPQAQWPAAITADGHKPAPLKELAPYLQVSAAKVRLGKMLFHDPRLSRDGTVSCASCHQPRLAFIDRRERAVGIEGQEGRRNTPHLFGLSHWNSLFWDGRAATLHSQALMPISDPLEMDMPIENALAVVNQDPDYRQEVKTLYAKSEMDAYSLADALVQFQLSIAPPDTLFQRFLRTQKVAPDKATDLLSDKQLQGLHLFRTKAQCMTCHQGVLLSDNRFHNTGLTYYGRKFEDLGRYNLTQRPEDVGRFRTPSLVGLMQSRPWMHNGLFNNLSGIVRMYNAGGPRPVARGEKIGDPLFPVTSPLLHKLMLTNEEIDAIVAFLETL